MTRTLIIRNSGSNPDIPLLLTNKKEKKMPNPTIRMTTGEEKYIAGFNPNGTTRFAYTEHD